MTNKIGPRPVKLVSRARRTWSNGEDRQYHMLTVPQEIADAIPEGTHFYPLLRADGSILYKNWKPEEFTRWLTAQANEQEDGL